MNAVPLSERIQQSCAELESLCAALVGIPSENPPGDTTALADRVEAFLAAIPGMSVKRVIGRAPAVNLVARLAGGRPGRRLLFNGHLDTFPAGDAAAWTGSPFSARIENGRLYGRGACDMKAGIAAAMMAAKLLADDREALAGELVLTFVSDEETGGTWGTQYVLANEPGARGDAMISADAGSPRVVRFGEKGQLWVELEARGRANHGAHVHLGDNAIVHLMAALAALKDMESMTCPIPADVMAAMREARPVSEPISGKGEFDTLSRLTVNIGTVAGGIAVNIIPDLAKARLDFRFPPGLALAGVLAEIERRMGGHPQVGWKVLSSHEPNVTEPGHEIVQAVLRHAKSGTAQPVVANMRPGFSDSRFYRAAGIAAVVYGPQPNNMGGPDEYVLLDELRAVFRVHVLAAADYLGHPGPF
jgi:acetylornithine deacetylase/succinyl-diaminopimelate desuccinylase-like protein